MVKHFVNKTKKKKGRIFSENDAKILSLLSKTEKENFH